MRGIIMITEMLSLTFMQRAIAASLMVAILGGYFGAFVVQRGLSFLGNGLAHAAFGGVALGILLRQEPLYMAVPFTLIVSLLIVWLKDHTLLGSDTVIGILFALSMAMGSIFLSMTPGYAGDAFGYLFGSLLSVTKADLWVTAGVMVLALGTIPAWGRWASATFDRELAMAEGMPCQRDDYVLAAALAVTTVVSMKVLGITLVAAFLVIPSASARLVSRTFASMTLLGMVFAVVGSLLGLVVSYSVDWPSGPSIILVQTAMFAACMLVGRRG